MVHVKDQCAFNLSLAASLEDMIAHAVDMLPDFAEASVFGLSKNADMQFRILESRSVLSALASIQPVKAKAAGPESKRASSAAKPKAPVRLGTFEQLLADVPQVRTWPNIWHDIGPSLWLKTPI